MHPVGSNMPLVYKLHEKNYVQTVDTKIVLLDLNSHAEPMPILPRLTHRTLVLLRTNK